MSSLLLLAFVLLSVPTACMVARVWGFLPALALSLVGLGGLGVVTNAAVSAATASIENVRSDCRIVAECGSDVIESFCAPSPSACPAAPAPGSPRWVGQSPAEGSPAYLAGER